MNKAKKNSIFFKNPLLLQTNKRISNKNFTYNIIWVRFTFFLGMCAHSFDGNWCSMARWTRRVRTTKLSQQLFKLIWMCVFWVSKTDYLPFYCFDLIFVFGCVFFSCVRFTSIEYLVHRVCACVTRIFLQFIHSLTHPSHHIHYIQSVVLVVFFLFFTLYILHCCDFSLFLLLDYYHFANSI